MHHQRLLQYSWHEEFPPQRKGAFFKARKALTFAPIRVQTIASIVGIDQTQGIGMPVVVPKAIREVWVPRRLEVCLKIPVIGGLYEPGADRVVPERHHYLGIVPPAGALAATTLAGLRSALVQRIGEGATNTPPVQEIAPF